MPTPLPSTERSGVFFTSQSHQILSACIHLLGASVLSYCLARRMPPLASRQSWTALTWGRSCVLLVVFDSWLFVFFTGVLVNGVGLSASPHTCALAIYACISFYAISKVLIYAFLVEKVHIVWSAGKHVLRSASLAYRICAVVMLGYVAVLILMIVGENSLIRSDGLCMIGLKSYATIPLLSYDLFLNVFLTIMFVWPLWRSEVVNPQVKKVATRTLYAAFVSLTTSAINVVVLISLKGEEYGWVCLGSCVTDVALNAMVLSWVTVKSSSSLPTATVDLPLPVVDPNARNFKLGMSQDDSDTNTARMTSRKQPSRLELNFDIPHDQQSDVVPRRASIAKVMGNWTPGRKSAEQGQPVSGVRVTVTQSTSVSSGEELNPSRETTGT